MKKFKQWDIHKNVTADEYAAIVRVQARRQAEGKRTAFRVRKRPVSQANISRYIRKSKKKGSPKPSVEGEAIVEAHTPPFIEYDTPPASPSSPTLSGGQGYADSITLTECGKPGSQSPTPDAITQGSTQLSAGIEFAASWKSGQWALGAVEDLSDSDPSSPATLVRSSHHQDSIIEGHSPRAFLIRRSPARAAQVMPGLTRHFMRQAHSPPRAVAMPDTLRYADGVLRSIRDYAGRDCSANLVNGFALMEAARYAEGRALLQAALAQYDECVRHCPYQAKFLSTFLSIHARHAPLHRAQAVVFDYVRRVLRRRLGALWPDHPLVRIVDVLFLATKSHAASVVRDPAIMLFVDNIYGRNSEDETVPGIDDKTVLMSPVRRWGWIFFSLRANFERVAGGAAVETGETSPPLRSLRRRLAELHSGIEAEQNPLFDCLLKLLVFVAHKGPVDMHLEPLYAHLIQYPGSMDKILSCAKDLVAGLWGTGRTRGRGACISAPW
ncbi:hypothetical protein RB597_007801 [Gaeumannomyces tritici]